MINIEHINVKNFCDQRLQMIQLAERIWTRPESQIAVIDGIDKWGFGGSINGSFYYIINDGKRIGLTGYFVTPDEGNFGLRYHGTTTKGTEKLALDVLVDHLRSYYGKAFQRLVEFIPEGREDLISIFERWGFSLSDKPIPEWEPNKYYFKYYMVLEI